MNKSCFSEIEAFMLSRMKDAAHDPQHVYRVLYAALDIAKREDGVDYDILIAACLLHDIGREREYENPMLCHAKEGGDMAFEYLTSIGWPPDRAEHVRACVASHRYRSVNPPDGMEAKILFDSDKLDATGMIGIARTLFYQGHENIPVYEVDANGNVLEGESAGEESFFTEWNFKLKKLYGMFYTKRGTELAAERGKSAETFHSDLFNEIITNNRSGRAALETALENDARGGIS